MVLCSVAIEVQKTTTIRYDTIEEFNMDSKAECVQLNLAHVARKKLKKEETKTNKHQCPLSSVHCTGSRSAKAVRRESE